MNNVNSIDRIYCLEQQIARLSKSIEFEKRALNRCRILSKISNPFNYANYIIAIELTQNEINKNNTELYKLSEEYYNLTRKE